jgi:hypothetical protein
VRSEESDGEHEVEAAGPHPRRPREARGDPQGAAGHELGTVAYDIITSQQQQAGQMYGWLVRWGLPQTGSRPPMAWVGGQHAEAHVQADGSMPGMATAA